MPYGIKTATFRDDGEVEEVFTSTTVRTRDLFGEDGVKSAIEAELQEFGESVRARPDEAEGPSLALRRPDVQSERASAKKCRLTEVESNPILRSCEEEPRRPVPTQRGATAQNPDEKTGASRGET